MSPPLLLCFVCLLPFVALAQTPSSGSQRKTNNPLRPLGYAAEKPQAVSVDTFSNVGFSTPQKTPFVPIGIQYHGGRILDSGINVYILWYGFWTTTQMAAITAFINALGSDPYAPRTVSGWWSINSLYYNSNGTFLSPNISVVTETTDSYSIGSGLNFDEISGLVRNQISNGYLPNDPTNGVYLVLSSYDVTYFGFCVSLCADRGSFFFDTSPSTDYLIGWIGDPSIQCPNTCSPNKSPSGNLTIDATINFVSQILSTVKTDPLFTGWYDSSTSSALANVEKCSFKFGTPLGDGSYNVKSQSGAKYYLQLNWNPQLGVCYIDNTTPPSPPPSPPPPPAQSCSGVYLGYKLEVNKLRLARTYKTANGTSEASCISTCNVDGSRCQGFSYYNRDCSFQSRFGGDSFYKSGGRVWVKC